MSPGRNRAASAAALAGLLVLASCGGGSEAPPAERPAPEPASPSASAAAKPAPEPERPFDPNRVEFEAVAKRLRDGNNAWLGLAPKRQLEQALAAGGQDGPTRYQMLMQLSILQVREGEMEAGLKSLDEAEDVLRSLLPRVADTQRSGLLADFHRTRAVAWMRQAELGNCVAHHSAASCILPLEGDGIHVDPEPSRKALESWRSVLAHRPGDLEARWFVNLLEATLGRHPDGVEESLRIDFAAGQAEGTVPRRIDTAAAFGITRRDLAGGVAVEDFDGDGLLDVVTSTSDPDGSLTYWRNAGAAGLEERTVEAGLSGQLGGLNLIAGDHDGDGDPDLLVLRGAWLLDDGRIRNSLLENDGHGTFRDVTRTAGLASPAYPTQAAAWADFDGDGDLDLFVGNEVRFKSAGLLEAFPSQLFRNEGDGTFTDVAEAAGVINYRQAKGVTVGDYDGDGDLDLFVSNVGPNRLYRNEGGLRFTEVAEAAGVVEPQGRSFVPWFFDFDHDGDLDLWVSGYQGTTADVAADLLGLPHRAVLPKLYRNRGDGSFEDATKELGLERALLVMGSNFGDVDGDGWLDMYLGTGDPEFTSLVPNVLLRNDSGRGFEDATFAAGLGHLQKGHGVAFADLNGNGGLDLFHQLGGFFRSDGFTNAIFLDPQPPRSWIAVKLEGTRSNRHGLGSRLRLELDTPAGPRTIYRFPGSVSSFGGSPLLRTEIPLGDATALRELAVRWPGSLEEQVLTGVPLNRLVTITEGSPELEARELTPLPWPPG